MTGKIRHPRTTRLLETLVIVSSLMFLGFVPITVAHAATGTTYTMAHAATGTTYYVDSVAGSDSNSGTSSSSPWKSLAMIDSTVLRPGDTVLFKAGDTWNGQLAPRGSGSPGDPITFASYGTGAKPVIAAGGNGSAAVLLSNEHDIVLDGFEVTNTTGQPESSTTPVCTGIEIYGQDAGTLSNITIEDNYVHDIDSTTSDDRNYESDPGAGGIVYEILGHRVPTRFSNLVIQDNEVADSDSYGISGFSTWMQRDGWDSMWSFLNVPSDDWSPYYPSIGMVIRGNYVHDISAGGIAPLVVDGTLIEHNTVTDTAVDHNNAAIWWADADATTVQYNVVSDTAQTANETDADAFDSDASTYGSLVQYNFSYNNVGGFFETDSAFQAASEALVRYNVSQDDGEATDQSGAWSAVFKFLPDTSDVVAVHNTIWAPAGAYSADAKMVWVYDTSDKGISFADNIFGNAADLPYTDDGSGTAVSYTNNLYYPGQPEPDDNAAVVGDPKLVSPGNATSLATLTGYALGSGSAAVGAADGNTSAGTRDILSNQVPVTGSDIGAVQTTGTGAPAVTTSFASRRGTSPSEMVNSDPATAWASADSRLTFPGTIDLTYPSKQTFSSVSIAAAHGLGQGLSNVTIRTWNGSSWVTQLSDANLDWASNTSLVEFRSLDLPSPVTTDRVQIVVNAANHRRGNISVYGIKLGNYILPQVSVSAPSIAGRQPGALVDEMGTATWSTPASGYSLPFDIDLAFRAPRRVNSVTISDWFARGQAPTNITIQTWDGRQWVTQDSDVPLSWSYDDSTIESDTVHLPSPVITGRVQIVVNTANQQWGNVAINQISVS
jgi:hypothetical protein